MTNNSRIAVVLPTKEIFSSEKAGAIALCVADFAKFSRHKNETTVFGGTDSRFTDIPYQRVMGPQRWYWRDSYAYAVNFSKLARQQEFTHVEVHNRPLILKYLNKLLPVNVATSLHLHNDPQGMEGLKTAWERQRLLDRSAAIYCVSEFIRTRFTEGVRHGLDKVYVVHNGIDTLRCYGDAKEKIVLYVGRIIQEKGVLPLAKAFRLAAPELPEWKFVICGNDRPGVFSEYEKLTHAELEALGSQCIYTGFVSHDEVMRYFAQSEISVIPSVWEEPFGRTALEALACFSAVITSGSGGLREIVGDSGITVQPLAPEHLAQAIINLANDKIKRNQFQERGHSRAQALFDIRAVSAKLDDIRDAIFPVTES